MSISESKETRRKLHAPADVSLEFVVRTCGEVERGVEAAAVAAGSDGTDLALFGEVIRLARAVAILAALVDVFARRER